MIRNSIMSEAPVNKGLEATRAVLQDLEVVVSLVRTLASSFGSASNLYRKLKKKSKDVKDHIKDHVKEDAKGEKEDYRREHKHRISRRDSHSDEERSHHRLARWESRSRSRSRRRRDESTDSDEKSINNSPSLVRAEYDYGYKNLGERFAIGDLITRNQLQYQIIALQQALLHIYEDSILHSDRHCHPTSYHLQQLVHTTRNARSASIDALAMQYKRMVPPPEVHEPHLPLPGAFPSSPTMYIPHHDTPDHSLKPTSGELFCIYARDLQHSHSLPLSDNFKPQGDHRCPYCHAHIAARLSKAWQIVKDAEKKQDGVRTFLVGTRFLVKSHRQGGGFACVLCSEYRDADTVCTEVRALIEHMWREHSCAELEWDDDIGEEL